MITQAETPRLEAVETPYGKAWMVSEGSKLLALQFGDPDAALKAAKRRNLAASSETASVAKTLLLLSFTSGEWPAALELAPQGTPFQQRVWQALSEIPRGETRSYRSFSETLGNVKAIRAVASACGANPIAIWIPCHRVIGSQGQLTGYRWGLDLKKRLLQEEGALP